MLTSCFEPVPETNEYAILPDCKKTIRWQQADLLESMPQEQFHLILLRNSVLTYFRGDKKEITFNKILHQLHPSGFLAIGSHEQLPMQTQHLHRSEKCPMVFRRTR
jgi:chemotaxis protein methyltransferase CheR